MYRVTGMALAACLMAGIASAAPPSKLQVQGRLQTEAGVSYDGIVDLTLKLFDDAVGGTALHTEGFDAVLVTQGVFSAVLGSSLPLPAAATDGTALWIEVAVDGGVLGERISILPVAYSFFAAHAGVADSALTSLDVACTGCVGNAEIGSAAVGSAQVNFPWARGVTADGAASDVACLACIGPDEVSFTFAASATKGGAASDAEKLQGYTWGDVPESTDTWVNEGGDTMSGALTVQAAVSADAIETAGHLGYAPLAAAPAAAEGRTYYDSAQKSLLLHNGLSWTPVGLAVPKGAVLFSQVADDPSFTGNGFAPLDSALRLAEGWSPTKTSGALSARYAMPAVWTGKVVVLYSGFANSTSFYSDGVRYNPATDAWAAMSKTGAPGARALHSGVWTGSQVIIWGGRVSGGGRTNSGGRYDPATDKWQVTSAGTGVPGKREQHSAIWTGSRMVIWGGLDTAAKDDGARYDPSLDKWSSMVKGPTARYQHSVVWTGSQVIIWGGTSGSAVLNDGLRYDPVADEWKQMAAAPAVLTARRGHSAVWTGSKMIVFGGSTVYNKTTPDKACAAYDPAANEWAVIDTTEVADSRAWHSAVWTGSLMLLWGGMTGDASYTNTGDVYDPAQGLWTPMNTLNAPSARYTYQTGSVWASGSMVVWGGYGGSAVNTGGVYQPGLTLYPYRKQ